MKQAEQAFVDYIRAKLPEYKDESPERVIDLTKFDILSDIWTHFASGWNAAVIKFESLKKSP